MLKTKYTEGSTVWDTESKACLYRMTSRACFSEETLWSIADGRMLNILTRSAHRIRFLIHRASKNDQRISFDNDFYTAFTHVSLHLMWTKIWAQTCFFLRKLRRLKYYRYNYSLFIFITLVVNTIPHYCSRCY